MTFFFIGYTPLHHCLTMYGGEETMAMARLLLDWGADPNARNRFGAVPLYECVNAQKMDFIQLLLSYGVNFQFVKILQCLNYCNYCRAGAAAHYGAGYDGCVCDPYV
jgi:ankyrin repeat protein